MLMGLSFLCILVLHRIANQALFPAVRRRVERVQLEELDRQYQLHVRLQQMRAHARAQAIASAAADRESRVRKWEAALVDRDRRIRTPLQAHERSAGGRPGQMGEESMRDQITEILAVLEATDKATVEEQEGDAYGQ